MLWFCLAALALCVALARGVRRSRSGRLLHRRRATTARRPRRRRCRRRWVTLSGFVFSGALAGLAGGLHVLLLHGARVGSYQPVQSVEVFSMATIGGLGSIGGAASRGAAGLRGLQDLDATIRLVAAGLGVLLVLWLRARPASPALAARVRDRPGPRRSAARRHGHRPGGPAAAVPPPSTAPAPMTAAPASPRHGAGRGARGDRGRAPMSAAARPVLAVAPASTCATASSRCCSAWTSRCGRARSSRCWAPTAPASRRCCKAMCGLSPHRRARCSLGDVDLTGAVRRADRPRGRRADARRQGDLPDARPSPSTCASPCWTFRGDHDRIAADPGRGAPSSSRSWPSAAPSWPATCPAASSSSSRSP